MRELAEREGIFAGVSSGGSVHGALMIAHEVSGTTTVYEIQTEFDHKL